MGYNILIVNLNTMTEETVTSMGANGDYGCQRINGFIMLNPSTPMEKAVFKSYDAAREMKTAAREYEAGESATGKEFENEAQQLAMEAIKEARSAQVRITQLNPAVVASNEACLISEMALRVNIQELRDSLMIKASSIAYKALRAALLAQDELTRNSSIYGMYPLNEGELLILS